MIAICEITGIEPTITVKVKDKENKNIEHERRFKRVWIKSSDEDLQGKWITFLKLWENEISENEGMRVGDMVSVRITPSSYHMDNGNFAQTVYIKLIGAACV